MPRDSFLSIFKNTKINSSAEAAAFFFCCFVLFLFFFHLFKSCGRLQSFPIFPVCCNKQRQLPIKTLPQAIHFNTPTCTTHTHTPHHSTPMHTHTHTRIACNYRLNNIQGRCKLVEYLCSAHSEQFASTVGRQFGRGGCRRPGALGGRRCGLVGVHAAHCHQLSSFQCTRRR